jgi:hypothetical protein
MQVLSLDPPSMWHASAVEGMLNNPTLARVLEAATTERTVPLYADERMELRADRLLLRDVAACDWHQVKLVLAHRPLLPIVVGAESRAPPGTESQPRAPPGTESQPRAPPGTESQPRAPPGTESQPRAPSTQSVRTPPRRPAGRSGPARAIALNLGDRVIALHGGGCLKFGGPNIF